MLQLCSIVFFYLGFENCYKNLIIHPKIKTFENANFIYTSFHAIISTLCSYLYIQEYVTQNTYLYILAISPAFAIFDIQKICDPRNKVNTKNVLIFHHSLIVLGYFLISDYLRVNDQHIEYVAYNYLSEISTPFLNMSIYLNKINKTNTKLFFIICILTLLSYLIFRIIVPGYVTMIIYNNDSYAYLLMQLPLNTMNYFWFYKLCKKSLEFIH